MFFLKVWAKTVGAHSTQEHILHGKIGSSLPNQWERVSEIHSKYFSLLEEFSHLIILKLKHDHKIMFVVHLTLKK